MFNKN